MCWSVGYNRQLTLQTLLCIPGSFNIHLLDQTFGEWWPISFKFPDPSVLKKVLNSLLFTWGDFWHAIKFWGLGASRHTQLLSRLCWSSFWTRLSMLTYDFFLDVLDSFRTFFTPKIFCSLNQRILTNVLVALIMDDFWKKKKKKRAAIFALSRCTWN